MSDQKRDLGPGRMQERLLQLLERASGSYDAADSILRYALAQAGLSHVPPLPDDVLAFVRAHVLGPLNAEVGPRRAMAFIDNLTDELESPPASGAVSRAPSSSAMRVTGLCVRSSRGRSRGLLLLVDSDAFRRASLARVLVQARWDVRTAQSLEQVLEAAVAEERPDAVVVDVDHPSAEVVVRRAVDQWPDVAVLLRGHPARAASVRDIAQVRVCSRDASVLDHLDALMGEP